jgi:ABC-type multidrug transport system ATPase subunit
MISVDKLAKSYGPVQALKGISFEVRKGEIIGLLGPNGAGKTTTMKSVTGYLQPSEGTARVDRNRLHMGELVRRQQKAGWGEYGHLVGVTGECVEDWQLAAKHGMRASLRSERDAPGDAGGEDRIHR